MDKKKVKAVKENLVKRILSSIEPWDFCTHKHHDERLAQAGPCPFHDAIGYCQFCATFLFSLQDMEKHAGGPEHYIQNLGVRLTQCAKMDNCPTKGETDISGMTPCLNPDPLFYCEYKLRIQKLRKGQKLVRK